MSVITGTDGADRIDGTFPRTSNADSISGLSGDDFLAGGGGNDTIDGGDGNDYIDGDFEYEPFDHEGTNHYYNGNDLLFGGTGSDFLVGGFGNDTIDGGEGNDTLVGGGATDILSGEQGSNFFVFTAGGLVFGDINPIGIDIITDFQSNINAVGDLDGIILDKTTFSDLTSDDGIGFSIASEFEVVPIDDDASFSSALIVFSQATGSLFYNQNGVEDGFGNGGQFATLVGVTELTPDSFRLDTIDHLYNRY